MLSSLHLSAVGMWIVFSLVTSASSALAQTTAPNQWTWRGGSGAVVVIDSAGDTTGLPGVYGVLGTPAPMNIPGARDYPSAWTDKDGNFWLFGGAGFDVNGKWGALNDLWKFNPTTNEWAWMGGSNIVPVNSLDVGLPGVYGTSGTPAVGNVPGSRDMAMSWTDKDGNLWLFGGFGSDANGKIAYLNDLWEFNPTTIEWAWMGGSNIVPRDPGLIGPPGVYGTLGTPAVGNIPGGRSGASVWTTESGDVWLSGGSPYTDLWKFNPSTNEWAWMGGSRGTSQPAVYGTLGTSAPGNFPGARQGASNWIDASGDLWLFGGHGVDAKDNFGILNDLWRFSPSVNQWAWMGGTSALNCDYVIPVNTCSAPSAVFGTLGRPAAENYPSSCVYAATWTDHTGNIWLFGCPNNVLWEFNPSAMQWTWMGGNSDGNAVWWAHNGGGAYGVLGSPSAGNIPGVRGASAAWADKDGKFWLFGGFGYGDTVFEQDLDDLWEYQPSSTPSFSATAIPTLSPTPGNYASAQQLTISDAMPRAVIYYTTDGVTTPTQSATFYTVPITISGSETIQAIAVAANYLDSAVAVGTYTIGPPAATPALSVPSGTYTAAQTVAMTDTTPGAAIHYTIDGTSPTTSSTEYSSPVTVGYSETVQAIAAATGYSASAVATATYTIDLPPPDFTIASSPTAVIVTAGQSGIASISITPQNSFNSVVSFACTGLPAAASCNFSPATVTPSTGSASTTLTIATSETSAVLHLNQRPLVPIAVLACALLGFGLTKRRHLRMLALLAVSLSGLSLLSACGGGSSGSGGGGGGSHPITSTITITATSGSLQHSATISLTVN